MSEAWREALTGRPRVEAVTDETGESNVTVIRDATLAHALRIAARDDYADRLSLAGLAMLPEAEARWYGRRDTA